MTNDYFLTDEQVEEEIAKLSESPACKLARKEQRLKYKRRQKLYSLRNLEKRGKELMKQGITLQNMEDKLFSDLKEESGDVDG